MRFSILAVCTAVVAAILLGAAPGAADDVRLAPEPPYVRDTERIERIAAGLREEPLFIDPSAISLLPEDDVESIRAAMQDQPVPVYVIVVPSMRYDESGGDAKVLLHAVDHAMDDDSGGVYIHVQSVSLASGYYSLTAAAINVPINPRDLDVYSEKNDLSRLLTALDSVRAAEPAPASSPTPFAVEQAAKEDEQGPPGISDRFTGDFWPGLILVGPFFGATAYGGVRLAAAGLRAARRRGRYNDQYRELPAAIRVRRAPFQPSTRWLHRTLRTELHHLSKELGSAAADHPGRSLAAVSFDAAGLIASAPRPSDHDLVGAIVLARDGRAAATGSGAPHPRGACMANPLHGAPIPNGERTPLPGHNRRGLVCGRCATAPQILRVLRIDGVAHYKHANLWTATEYGRTVPDLAQRALKELDVD